MKKITFDHGYKVIVLIMLGYTLFLMTKTVNKYSRIDNTQNGRFMLINGEDYRNNYKEDDRYVFDTRTGKFYYIDPNGKLIPE